MNLIKQCKGQLLLTILLLFLILASPFQDYMERIFLMDSMSFPEDAAGVERREDGILTVSAEGSGVTLTSDLCYLKQGTYQITLSVVSEEEGSSVELFDPTYVNSDNTAGQVLASAQIPASGDTTVTLTCQIEEAGRYVQFRIHAAQPMEFHSIYLLSESGLYRDPYICAALLLLLSALLFFVRSRRKLRPETLILLAFAALWSSAPLSVPGLLDGHDIYFHYSRLFNVAEGLLDGQFPVRIHSQMYQGFTYMESVFYPELLLYPFALFSLLGMSPIGCYKLLLVACNFAAAGIGYYSFSRLCHSRKIGLTAAFLYTLAQYRLINLYTRAAIGEMMASIFLPLLMLGMYQLFLGESRKWLTAALAFTALLQSHLITTELAIAFSVVFALCHIRRLREPKRLLRLFLAAGATVLLNLWFILPLLDMMRYPVSALGEVRDLNSQALYALQLFDTGVNNPSGDAFHIGSVSGEMPFSVGLVLLLGSLIFLFVCFSRKSQDLPLKLGKWCLALGGFSLYASSVYFPWELLQSNSVIDRLAGNIQFPFRFLPFATAFLCVTAAVGICGLIQSSEHQKLLFLLCAGLSVYSSGMYFSNYADEAESFVSWDNQLDHVMDTDSLYVMNPDDISFLDEALLEREAVFLPSEGVTVTDTFREGTNAAFTYSKAEGGLDSYVDLPFNNYPCFHAYDENGQELDTDAGELLRLRVMLPEASEGTVTVRFELPGFYRVGDAVSLLTALLLVLWLLSRKRLAHKNTVGTKGEAESHSLTR